MDSTYNNLASFQHTSAVENLGSGEGPPQGYSLAQVEETELHLEQAGWTMYKNYDDKTDA